MRAAQQKASALGFEYTVSARRSMASKLSGSQSRKRGNPVSLSFMVGSAQLLPGLLCQQGCHISVKELFSQICKAPQTATSETLLHRIRVVPGKTSVSQPILAPFGKALPLCICCMLLPLCTNPWPIFQPMPCVFFSIRSCLIKLERKKDPKSSLMATERGRKNSCSA